MHISITCAFTFEAFDVQHRNTHMYMYMYMYMHMQKHIQKHTHVHVHFILALEVGTMAAIS